MVITKNDLYQALGAKLKPIIDSLGDVKNELNALNTSINDLNGRLKAIEIRLAERKTKV